MADFKSKLNNLEVSRGPPRASITDLIDPAAITGARLHSHREYGTSIILDIIFNGIPHIVFLPKRFALNLTQAEIDSLAAGGYKIKCTGMTGRSPNVQIFQ